MADFSDYAPSAAGVIGSILNYISNERTNRANIQMQEAANQANRDIAREQNDWNLMMWQKQNAYNDPSAQMSRLRAAGINPALAYANGGMMNEAAPAQEAAGATMQAAQIKPYYNDPLMLAQIANLNANTRKVDSETQYQNYLNDIEKALAHSPIGRVSVVAPDGSESVEVVYGNARVEFERSLLRNVGLDNLRSSAELNALLFDIAVLTGSDSFANSSPGVESPSDQPGYPSAVASLRGDQQTKSVAGQLAQLSKEAAEAEKAGRKAYAEWLDKHGDEPLVKFMLSLQGFVQTLGVNLPSISVSGNSQSYGHVRSSSQKWFFGSR